ncbi:MAG: hypothetical protein ACRDBO_03940 [Lachnospiraceae bacterium]
MSQGDRYLEFAARAGAGQKLLDSSYRAAFYLLSYDAELASVAIKNISLDGIDFAAIKRQTKGFDETSRHVIDIAHNLFSYNSKCKATPFEMSRLGYPFMEQVCNAIYIAGDQYDVELDINEENQVTLHLDKSSYEQTIQLHKQFDGMYAKMLAAQEVADDEVMER